MAVAETVGMLSGGRPRGSSLSVVVLALAYVLASSAPLDVDARRAGARIRSAYGGGTDNEGNGGKPDEATVIVTALFAALALLFCVLGGMSRVGASRLSMRDARARARAAAEEMLDLPPLPDGARVTLRHKGQGADIDTKHKVFGGRGEGEWMFVSPPSYLYFGIISRANHDVRS